MLHLQSWKRHFFCLTKDKLFWTEEQTRSEEDDDDEGLEGAGAGEVNMMVKCIILSPEPFFEGHYLFQLPKWLH